MLPAVVILVWLSTSIPRCENYPITGQTAVVKVTGSVGARNPAFLFQRDQAINYAPAPTCTTCTLWELYFWVCGCIAGFKSKAIPYCHDFFQFQSRHPSPHAPLLGALYGNCVSVCISSQGWDSNQMRFHIAIMFFSILIYLWHNTLGKEVILLNSYFLFEFVLQKSWNIKASAKLL